MPPAPAARLFVVIGAQRTGTNLLRELLNTHEHLAMLGEVMTPSAAPAHFANFLGTQPAGSFSTIDEAASRALLDRYFSYVDYRIRNYWAEDDKRHVTAIGVDIKYNQLRAVQPAIGDSTIPYLLAYIRLRSGLIIHTTRANVIHTAVSAFIAGLRNVWHNYEGRHIERSYRVDPHACLAWAREIQRARDDFMRDAAGCEIIDCPYEGLVETIRATPPGSALPERPGPLRAIAAALGVPFRFRHTGRLHKAIDVPYAQVIENYAELIDAIRASEFASLAGTLV